MLNIAITDPIPIIIAKAVKKVLTGFDLNEVTDVKNISEKSKRCYPQLFLTLFLKRSCLSTRPLLGNT